MPRLEKRQHRVIGRPTTLEHGEERSSAAGHDGGEQFAEAVERRFPRKERLILNEAAGAVEAVPMTDGIERIEERVEIDDFTPIPVRGVEDFVEDPHAQAIEQAHRRREGDRLDPFPWQPERIPPGLGRQFAERGVSPLHHDTPSHRPP